MSDQDILELEPPSSANSSIQVGDKVRVSAREAWYVSTFRPAPGEAHATYKAATIAAALDQGLEVEIVYSRVQVIEDFITDDYLHELIYRVVAVGTPKNPDPLMAGAGNVIAAIGALAGLALLGHLVETTSELIESAGDNVPELIGAFELAVGATVILALLFYFGSTANRAASAIV